MGIFDKNVDVEEEAFLTAAADLEALSKDLDLLSGKINRILDTLGKGFDTPAGVKFYRSCEENLLSPIKAQRLALDHISKSLSESKADYRSVFDSYNEVNRSVS